MFRFLGRKVWKAPGGERVVRKEISRRPGPSNVQATFEIWTAPSAESAKEYLNSRKVTRSVYYLVVETPEGNWGKDCMGVYRE
jgi:hypothetical protein